MLGELREASAALSETIVAKTVVAMSCPACAAERPGPVGGTCRVCGQRLTLVTVEPDTLGGTSAPLVAGEELEESIVSFAKKRWSETLHPRDPGGQGGGQFARGSGGGARAARPSAPSAPKPSAPSKPRLATSRRPHSEHGPKGTRTRATPHALPPKAGGMAGDAPKLSEKELAGAVGQGVWSAKVSASVSMLRAGTGPGKGESEDIYRLPGTGGKLGAYTPERVALHARIVNLLFQGSEAHAAPEALFMAGGGGSGKSSLIKAGLAKPQKDAVDINPDIIKTMLPEYQALVAADDKRAAALMHEESSHIAKTAMNLAILRRHHLTVDGTGNGGPGSFMGKINATTSAGYSARVVYATIPAEVAVARAKARAEKPKEQGGGRAVPEGHLRSAHESVSRVYDDEVRHLKGIPIDIYDNTGKKPVLVAQHARSGALTVHRRTLYQEFVDKRDPSIAAAAKVAKDQKEAVDWIRRNSASDVSDGNMVLGSRSSRG